MGNMIGILSTVILVSTLTTLIFAVGAYIMARRRKSDVGEESTEAFDIPERSAPLTGPPVAETAAGKATKASISESGTRESTIAVGAADEVKPVFRQLVSASDNDGLKATESSSDWE